MIRVWLDILVGLLKAEGRTNWLEFCDEEGYMISASAIEDEFHSILEEIQELRDRSMEDSITSGLDA